MKRIFTVLMFVAVLIGGTFAAIRNATPQVVPPDGEVYALHAGSTLNGMRSALSGNQGTMILMKDQMVTFMWSVDKGWAFATLNGASKSAVQDFAQMAGGKGNLVNFKTMTDVRVFLENQGWSKVDPSQVPDVIKIGLGAASGWISAVASNMTTFIVLAPGFTPPEGAVQVWR